MDSRTGIFNSPPGFWVRTAAFYGNSAFQPPNFKKIGPAGPTTGATAPDPAWGSAPNPRKNILKLFLGLNYLNFFNFFFRTTPDPRGSADIFWRTPPRDPLGGMRKRNLNKFVKEVNLERKEAANRGAPGAGVIEDPDDDLHRIIRLECARVKLPKKVVLMRWLGCELCVNVMIGA